MTDLFSMLYTLFSERSFGIIGDTGFIYSSRQAVAHQKNFHLMNLFTFVRFLHKLYACCRDLADE